MKKVIFIFLIFALVTLAACADTGDMFMGADVSDTSYAQDLPEDTEDFPEDEVSPESENAPFNPGGRFCTEHLAEGEVLTVYDHGGDSIIFRSIDDMLGFIEGVGTVHGGSRFWRSEVIRGEVLDERTAWHNSMAAFHHEGALPNPIWDLPDEYEPVTLFRVRVLEVFQGEFEVGEIIEVMQVGGQIDNVHFMSYEFVPLTSGDDFVFFLASLTWMPPSPAVRMSSSQAVYRFPDLGDGMRAFSADESLECVIQSSAALTLTFGDLMDLQIQNFGQVSESFAAMVR